MCLPATTRCHCGKPGQLWAIGTNHIYPDSIGSMDIKDGQVKSKDIDGDAITSAHVKTGAIESVEKAELVTIWRL